VATARPTSLDVSATSVSRYAPGEVKQFLTRLHAALGAERPGDDEQVGELAALLGENGPDVVILWSERIGPEAAALLARIARQLDLGAQAGAGLLQIPAGANERGLREAGVVPDAGPGYAELPGSARSPRGMAEIARAAADGDISALYLFHTDPVRDLPDRALWEGALAHAALVVAHASVLTEGLREHASVIFPAESYAEKEGTIVHPDGRLQRLRIAVAHSGAVQAGWAVLTEIAHRAGVDFGIERSADAFDRLVAAVPFYEGLTLEEIGGRGARWPERPQAASLEGSSSAPGRDSAGVPPDPAGPGATAPPSPADNGSLRLGTYRPIWASPEVEISPALKFAVPTQHLELSPHDAQRLQIANGDAVEVSSNGTRLQATAAVHSGVRPGSAFLAEGIAEESANALTEPLIEVHKL
jgi:NADH-quinone oxidoreductase subunit G